MNDEARAMTDEMRDERVGRLLEELNELERRLIPTGLHVFGEADGGAVSSDVLRMVASFERPEQGVRALPALVSEALGLEAHDDSGSPRTSEDARERVDEFVRGALRIFTDEGSDAACRWLEDETGVRAKDSRGVFRLLREVRERLRACDELESLARGLRGEYIEPGPGADVIQNPEVLPTGRNTHAVNPYSVPSHTAFARARNSVELLLERHRAERGGYPRAMALVLWGLDNIKTQGEGVAQALWLLGVRPSRDSLNRVSGVEIIPLEELGRPRIDVVMTVSGIFRDLFAPTMQLLDLAVRRVVDLDESNEWNYVRRNVREQAEAEGCSADDAALRVFSNAPGSYGTNVNFMVTGSHWENAEALGQLFVKRKCFAYGRDGEGRALEGREAPEALSRALARVEATHQNLDSFEIGVTDVDHYFEYLGGVSRAVEMSAGARPSIYVSDALTQQARVRSLSEMIALETRTKTLNPKWYEGMLKHGFRGVAEIESHLTNTFGWSATTDAVDEWVYTEVARTFVLDEEMLERLRDLNPHSARTLVARLLEVEGRGFWRPGAETVEKLREVFNHLEDRLEGVA